MFVGFEGVDAFFASLGWSVWERCEGVVVESVFNGVLKGDRNGLERVEEAASRRRRLA